MQNGVKEEFSQSVGIQSYLRGLLLVLARSNQLYRSNMNTSWKKDGTILYLGDCLEVMKRFKDKAFDMILCDLPYGTTKCKWDTIIPFEPLWEQYKRTIKDRGVIVLTATQPFTSILVMSNIKWFKYEWVWDKVIPRGHLVAKKRPMQQTESAIVFYFKPPMYNPQMILRDKPVKGKEGKRTTIMGGVSTGYEKTYTHKYPVNLIRIKPDKAKLVPTQKPVALFEYLIKTYTNERDIVLDNCIGSGTTAIACINTGRRCVGIEKDEDYFKLSIQRISDHIPTQKA